MPGPHPAVAATRVAVRRVLADLPAGGGVVVGVSGGPDSLALAAAVAFELDPGRPSRLPRTARAVVVDHGLQPGSRAVAERAALQCAGLGLAAEVVAVTVDPSGDGGPEARARRARHDALEEACRRHGADALLLGHTRDDQAEQVLLGLARGSGTRSLSGMPSRRGVLHRPFLGVDRATTLAACVDLGLEVWHDPHNDDPRYLRVRARTLLHLVEEEVPGIRASLARSADLLRDDADALDDIANALLGRLGESPWSVERFAGRPSAVRRRLWRGLVLRCGVSASALRSTHLVDLDALVTRWRGQGPVDLPGGGQVAREGSLLVWRPPVRAEGPRRHEVR